MTDRIPADLTAALTEWRDARQAIFDHEMGKPTTETVAKFDRLAKAEHALMDVARLLPNRQETALVSAFIHIPLVSLLRLVPRALRLAIRHKAIEDCKDVIREMEIKTMGREGWNSPNARALMFARHRLGDLQYIGETPTASKPVRTV